MPGDEFILDCYYDSSNFTRITYGGESTTEEMCQAYVYVYPKPALGDCISRFTDAQFEGFLNLATAAGYLTGSGDNLKYDLGGSSYTYSGITWQNGAEMYHTLWQETEWDVLATRYQACYDIDGNRLNSAEYLEIPSGFVPYEATETCEDIINPVGQIGDYNTLPPTPATDSPSKAPSQSPEETVMYVGLYDI